MERPSHAHAMNDSPVWRISHGQATCQRRTLAMHRTALASTQASSLPVPRCKPSDYRKVLTGIIFVLKTGIPWEKLPQEILGRSGPEKGSLHRNCGRTRILARSHPPMFESSKRHGPEKLSNGQIARILLCRCSQGLAGIEANRNWPDFLSFQGTQVPNLLS